MEQGPPPSKPERPMSVTILAVLYFIQGIMMMASVLVIGALFGALGFICMMPFILLGIIFFLIGGGLLAGQSWAATVAFILAIIGLIGIPIGTLISIIIIIYLRKPEVKAYFGKM